MLFNLQLFADEQGAPSGMTGLDAAAANGQDASGDINASPAQDAAVSFEDMLKSNPSYEAEYNARVKKALDGRYKEFAGLKERQNKAMPMFALLAGKYGVEPGEDGSFDQDAIMQAILDDDSYYEDEALSKGMSVAQLKETKRLERENAELKQQVEMRNREDEDRAFFADLVQQGEAAKQFYPTFDLQAELANPQFARLVMNGVPVKGAFEAVHMNEIMGGAMQYAAQRVTEKVSNAYQANKGRPRENGTSSNLPVSSEFNPAALTKEQRRAIRERVNRGEKVSF